MYQEACQNFLKILAINKNSYFAQKNLIYILNFINPANTQDHLIFEINSEIKKLVNNIKNKDINQISNLKKIMIEND